MRPRRPAPCSTWRCRRHCSAGSPQGIAGAGRAEGARVMVEKPFGTDLHERPGAERDDARGLPRGRDLPGGPLARAGPARERARSPGSPTRCSSRCSTATTSTSIQITMAEAFDVADRGRVLRPDRRDPRRRAEPHAAGAGQRARRPARRHRCRLLAATAKARADRRAAAADRRRRRCAASTRATTTSEGVDPDSTTETYVAVRLAVDSWRWAGVPIAHPRRQVPCRSPPPRSPSGSAASARRLRARRRRRLGQRAPLPDLARDRGRAHAWPARSLARPAGRRSCRSWTFAQQPRLGHAALRPADRCGARRASGWLFARQDTVEAAWRVVDPVLGDAVPVHPYARGSWGPGGRRPAPRQRHLARPAG